MARDYREFIKERATEDKDFGSGLHQYCLDLLQSSNAEDRRDGESMLLNYFGVDVLREAQQEAATPGEPATSATG